MNPRSRGRSPVPSRVARKLADTDTAGNVFCIPYRPRNDAAYLRKTAAADIVVTTQSQRHQTDSTDRDPRPLAAADALSLSGSTPPSSPTMSNFPGGPKVIMSDVNEMTTSDRPQLVLIDSQGNVAVNDRDDSSPVDASATTKDLPFRRHNRGIGSIDSILSSTTCVNTHSECSRAESRLSREIRIEIEDLDGGVRLASHQTGANMYAGADYSTSMLEDTCPHRNIQLGLPSTARPGSSLTCRDLEEYGELDEERLIDEISSWVLRNTYGKDVDDCASPLLIWDCTYRYVQELWSAAHEGSLGIVQASGHGTPSSQGGGGSPGEGGSEQQSSGYFGKGKRKAEGGSEDGSGLGGGRDNMGDEDGDTFMGLQGYSSNKSGITNYSCPYRKRNPLRFNVREHYVCATHSFSDMSQLKKHIRAHHPPVQRNAGPFLCPRCCQGFPSKSDLDCHLRQLTVCRLSDDHGGADPEDGITQKIISSLEARSLKAKIDNWVSLWKLLFPHDSTIPEPVFIPVMEVFDFIAESKKFVVTLKDLLELQYRHVLEGATQAIDVELKIRQGLERSTQSIYTWIETVMQDWEQRICGTVSFFSPSSVERTVAASDVSESWPPSSQLLPPSPASTPTVVSGNLMSTVPGGAESPVSAVAPAARVTSAAARRRPNPPPKRIKREALPKIQPSTQIPVPIQRARTPQLSSRASTDSFRASRPAVLPSQAVLIPTSSAPHLESAPAYPQPSWDSPAVTVPDAYTIPYTTAGEMFQNPIPAPTHYSPVTHSHNQLEAQGYLPHDHPQLSPDAVHVPTTEALQQRDMSGRPQSNISTSTISTVRASRLMTPRSSIASNWIRDENRDSSQTLVEAHPPGRCQNMYCPSCSKALPDDVGVTMTVHSPVGMHHGIGVGGHPQQQQQHLHQHQHQHQQHHGVFHTGAAFPAVTAPGDVHNFVGEQVEWGFQQGGGAHHDNMFGGHGGPQEGY